MSWFESATIATLAKSAMKNAQKTLDKALVVNEDEAEGGSTSWGSFTGSFFDAKEVFKAADLSSDNTSTIISSEPSSVISSEPLAASNQLVSPTFSADAVSVVEKDGGDVEDDGQSTDSTMKGSQLSSSSNIMETIQSSTSKSVEDSTMKKNDSDFTEVSLEAINDNETMIGSEEGSIDEDKGVLMISCEPELLITEAMIDQSEKRSETESSSSKSYEVVKTINSSHTSGDEMETHTSSSDIEIISSPPPSIVSSISSNHRCGSPRREKVINNLRRDENYEVNETLNEMMLDSQLDDLEKIPVLNTVFKDRLEYMSTSMYESHRRTESELSITGSDEGYQAEIDRLLKKSKEMNEILEARETKIVDLSRYNIELQEKNTDLSSQIKEAMKINNKLQENSLTIDEFTSRLSTMEKKLQQTLKERDSLKDELKTWKKNASKRKSDEEWKDILKEKEDIVIDLREEGERLSKQAGKYSELIKKLRAKEKSLEKENKSFQSDLEDKTKECDRLKKSLKAKDEVESKQIEAIQNFSTSRHKLEQENEKLKSSLEEANEKSDNLRCSLENAYKEMVELKRGLSAKEDEAAELALSKEMTAKIALQEQLRSLQEKSLNEKETLYVQIDELRSSLSHSERSASRREEQLIRERDDLQNRLEESETRNHELSGSVGAATLPLQRQIESLQASLRESQNTGERVEQSLNERLRYISIQLGAAQERDRSVSEEYTKLSSKLSILETQHQEILKSKQNLEDELLEFKEKCCTIEDSKSKELSASRALKSSLSQEVEEIRREKRFADMAHQNETIEMQKHMEKLEVAIKQKEIKINEMQCEIDRSNVERSSCRSSPFSSVSEHWMDEAFDNGKSRNNNSFYDSIRVGGNSLATLVENYSSSLKLREGAVAQLQAEVISLEKMRDSMANELSSLTLKVEKMDEYEKKVSELTSLYQKNEEKYQTLLTMYGEKVEETEELKLDLQDVKEMYKVQIQELVQSQRN